MKVICVDDEEIVLAKIVSLCEKIPVVSEVKGFADSQEVLAWSNDHIADVALLDINMPDMDGLMLAARIKERHPDTRIIFVTGYPEYAVDAFKLRVSGYLLKPVTKGRLEEELLYVNDRQPIKKYPHIEVQTFGGFEVFVDGNMVHFGRSKAKELLAYLVDRRGKKITRTQASGILWEGKTYDRPMQKQMDVIIRSLRSTLEEYGIGEIVKLEKGELQAMPESFICDLYRYLDGDVDAVNAYRGEYMASYSWASITEAYMDRMNSSV